MDNDSVALARRYGAILAVVSAVGSVLFLVGIARRSYAALALPLAAIVLGGFAVTGWIGRLLMTTPDLSDERDF